MVFAFCAKAQDGVVTFGIQFRPLVPNRLVDFSEVTESSDTLIASWNPRTSLNFGMVVRFGITPAFSIESGINLVRRNYTIDVESPTELVQSQLRYAFVGYEVPIQALYYVQLSDQLWMNASGGLSVDLYPSDVFSTSSTQRDTLFYDFEQYTGRRAWAQLAVQANYGFEWRTKDKGYFYLGATYHQPFTDMAWAETLMKWQGGIHRLRTDLTGNYFTVDLRYFFHEPAERRRP